MADIRLATKLMPTPKRAVNVYRLKAPAVSERSVRALARNLGMTADAKRSAIAADADKLVLSSGTFDLRVYRASGGFRFIDRSRWQVDDRQADLDITDAAALRTAQGIAKQFGLIAGGESRFLKAARLRVGAATAQGKEASQRTIDVAVALQRLVDKLPVDGPGGKLVVYLDHEGRATGIERIWRALGAAQRRNLPCRSPREALDEMAQHLRTKHGTVTVEEVRFGYFEEGLRSEQRLLQPAYVIKGLVGEPDSPVRRKLIYVARALADAKQPLTPPLVRKPKQRARPAAG